MRHSIPEDIASLDIESIDFNNKDLLKSLILKLLDTIEQLATDVLPPDAEFKGYRSVIKQNIKFKTDNVKLIVCYLSGTIHICPHSSGDGCNLPVIHTQCGSKGRSLLFLLFNHIRNLF